SMPFSISIRFSWVSNLMRSFFQLFTSVKPVLPRDIPFQMYELLPCSFCERCIYIFKLSQSLRDRLFFLYRHVGSNQHVYILKSCRLPACEAFYRTFINIHFSCLHFSPAILFS